MTVTVTQPPPPYPESSITGLVTDLATLTTAAAAAQTTANAAVPKSLYDAETILIAISDNTPVALVLGASTILGRKASGDIAALTGSDVITITGAALDSAVVHNTGTENVGGAKTFTTGLIVSSGSFQVDSSGRVGQGGAANTAIMHYFSGTHPSGQSTGLYGIDIGYTIPSTMTGTTVLYAAFPVTAAASFTVGTVQNFQSGASTIGASSAITTHQGFFSSNLGKTGITNAYGFYGTATSGAATLNVTARFDTGTTCALWLGGDTTATDVTGGIAFGSGRDVTLYRSGAATLRTNSALTVDGALTASTSLVVSAGNFQVDSSGRLGLGGNAVATNALILAGGAAHPGSSSTLYGLYSSAAMPSTTTAAGNWVFAQTRLTAAYTMTIASAFYAEAPSLGASSLIGTAIGANIKNQGHANATNSYGIFVTAQSGSATLTVSARLDTATTAALWLGGDATSSTVAGGIAFGSGRDVTLFRGGSGVLATNSIIKYTTAANCTTGVGSALLGANCPAVTVTAPYKWLTFQTDDGSTVYVPAWK